MKKKLIIISGCIILAMAAAGFWLYDEYFRPDPEIRAQLSRQFGEDFFSFDILDSSGAAPNAGSSTGPSTQGGLETGLSGETTPQGNAAAAAGDAGAALVTPDGSVNNGSGNANNPQQVLTEEKIVAKHSPKFVNLRNTALSRLDTLYTAAKQEYKQSVKAGKPSKKELAQKYLQAGTMLEKAMDEQFDSALSALQAELQANNCSTDIIKTIRAEYEQTKKNKRSELLSRVL